MNFDTNVPKVDNLTEIIRFCCNICEYKHYLEESVKLHIEAHHTNSEKARSLRIGCELCERNSVHQECLLPLLKLQKKHKCIECDYSSNFETVLKKHIDNLHKKILRFACNLCDFKHFHKHCIQYHQEKQHKSFTSKKRILKINCLKCEKGEDHQNCVLPKLEAISKTYKCNYDECDYSTNFNYALKYHFESYHEKIARYACNGCDYKFYHKSAVRFHQKTKHTNSENKVLTIGCEDCEEEQEHTKCFRRLEKSQRPKLKDRVKSPCNLCDYIFDSSQSKADHYKENHSESKLYSCDQCIYGSNYSQNLKTHMETVHHNKQFACHICDYVTKWNTQYHSHMRDKHAIYKNATKNSKCELKNSNFQCSSCEYSSSYKGNLNEHINRVHGGSKFNCSICDFVTKSKQYLKAHEDVQHNGKTFECDKCTHKATSKSNLRVHQDLKHSNKTYDCNSCSFKCKSKQYLKQHKSKGCF